jgi:DNA-directed RNA polymerase subunit RPC12/RpoP
MIKHNITCDICGKIVGFVEWDEEHAPTEETVRRQTTGYACSDCSAIPASEGG